ncbi:IclR family transcriptional regulator [halophilic archaeon]|nr:IclR family transcriptional regulator [halophilic archaeon]
MKQDGNQMVGATKSSIEVLDAIRESGGEAETSELVNRLSMAQSTVYKHLRTLEDEGFVVKHDGYYRIGSRCLEFGGFVRRYDDIFQTTKGDIQDMAEETGELANLMFEEQGMGVYVYTVGGENAVNIDTGIGKRVHLNCTALGKALLSTMTENRIDEIIDQHGLPQRTDNTITTRDALMDEINRIRNEGVAYERSQRVEGICCVAAPITTEKKRCAAISISGPERRMSEDRLRNELTEIVQRAANVIELNIMYD